MWFLSNILRKKNFIKKEDQMLTYKELLSLTNQDHHAHSKRIYISFNLLWGLDHIILNIFI